MLGVVRLRMGVEQRKPKARYSPPDGLIDPCAYNLLHYMSAARLTETQKKQKEQAVTEAFQGDLHVKKQHDIGVKHAQLHLGETLIKDLLIKDPLVIVGADD